MGYARHGTRGVLIAKKVVGEVMIIERLARYHGRPRPPSDTCQLNVRIFWPVSVDRTWPRLAIGAVFRSFSGGKRFLVFCYLRRLRGCKVCVTNAIRILPSIRGQARQRIPTYSPSTVALNMHLCTSCTNSFFATPTRNAYCNLLALRIPVTLAITLAKLFFTFFRICLRCILL